MIDELLKQETSLRRKSELSEMEYTEQYLLPQLKNNACSKLMQLKMALLGELQQVLQQRNCETAKLANNLYKPRTNPGNGNWIEPGAKQRGRRFLHPILKKMRKINHHGRRRINSHAPASEKQRQRAELADKHFADEYLRLSYHGRRAEKKKKIWLLSFLMKRFLIKPLENKTSIRRNRRVFL